ncbi:hypothetical protein FGO68_gene12069 [Halteria grandinella]|uniref:Uncharacterized protein n=1 Tax=Halteria grandinella TaxID=5974 RepID=A0A8J8NXI8_HALGN|nr:hypothetical protein FGO68_gene12069 [Halteria grandinella]
MQKLEQLHEEFKINNFDQENYANNQSSSEINIPDEKRNALANTFQNKLRQLLCVTEPSYILEFYREQIQNCIIPCQPEGKELKKKLVELKMQIKYDEFDKNRAQMDSRYLIEEVASLKRTQSQQEAQIMAILLNESSLLNPQIKTLLNQAINKHLKPIKELINNLIIDTITEKDFKQKIKQIDKRIVISSNDEYSLSIESQ